MRSMEFSFFFFFFYFWLNGFPFYVYISNSTNDKASFHGSNSPTNIRSARNWLSPALVEETEVFDATQGHAMLRSSTRDILPTRLWCRSPSDSADLEFSQ